MGDQRHPDLRFLWTILNQDRFKYYHIVCLTLTQYFNTSSPFFNGMNTYNKQLIARVKHTDNDRRSHNRHACCRTATRTLVAQVVALTHWLWNQGLVLPRTSCYFVQYRSLARILLYRLLAMNPTNSLHIVYLWEHIMDCAR